MDDDVSHAVEDRLLALEERVTALEGGSGGNGDGNGDGNGVATEATEEPDVDEEGV